VRTCKFLTFLFLVSRAALGRVRSLEPIIKLLQDRVDTSAWWHDYWETPVEKLARVPDHRLKNTLIDHLNG